MHSFTSSFKPLPHGFRSLVIGLALAALWLVGYEVLWRARGFTPTLNDSDSLWCSARGSIAPDGIVVLGSSRLQVGIDPQILSQELGGRPVTQLALAGSNPIPMLLDLAADRSFHGLVVFEYMPRRIFTPDSWSWSRSEGFLTSCRNPSLVAPIENAIGRKMQERFVFELADLQPIAVASYVARHHALPDGHQQAKVRADRYTPAHFRADQTDTGADEYWATMTDAELEAQTARMKTAVSQIRARGGDVIIYRSPVTGGLLADEEGRFPAATWLPKLGQMLDVRTIDFAQVPALRDVRCPDGEHPSFDQVPSITKAVAAELRDRTKAR